MAVRKSGVRRSAVRSTTDPAPVNQPGVPNIPLSTDLVPDVDDPLPDVESVLEPEPVVVPEPEPIAVPEPEPVEPTVLDPILPKRSL